MRIIATGVAVLALMAVGAGGAQAKLVKVTGSTAVTPSQQAAQFLSNNGVSVSTVGAATSGGGAFTFPIAAGFGDTKTYRGLLAHSGGLKFSKGDRSVVLRRFIAVRAGKLAVLLAQIPGARGGCGHIAQAARRFAIKPDRDRYTDPFAGLRYPKAAKRVIKSVKRYCKQGKVVVLANLTNLGKSVEGKTATLTADLTLSRQAARLINRVAGKKAVGKGAPLGSATSTVTRG
ncbi:MAG: hypothetical protein JW895_12685 [Thermoleophilaceae bacterium]|nr:hypothetical protein [Thermoleophilaceae bacterium]